MLTSSGDLSSWTSGKTPGTHTLPWRVTSNSAPFLSHKRPGKHTRGGTAQRRGRAGPSGAGRPRASRWHSQELLSRQLALEVPGAQVSLEFRWAQRHRLGLSPLETPGWDKNGVRTDTVP